MKIESIEPIRVVIVNVPGLQYQRMRIESMSGSNIPGAVFWYQPTVEGWEDVGEQKARDELEKAWQEFCKEQAQEREHHAVLRRKP